MLFHLISHLKPEAKQWYQLLPDETKGDYAQLCAAFKERISPNSQGNPGSPGRRLHNETVTHPEV